MKRRMKKELIEERRVLNDYPEKILNVLRNSSIPLDVEKIRVGAGIGNWQTALKHCLELTIDQKIKALRTSKSWVFWIEKK